FHLAGQLALPLDNLTIRWLCGGTGNPSTAAQRGHTCCLQGTPGRSCPRLRKANDMTARTTLRLFVFSSAVIAGASLPVVQNLRADSSTAATTLPFQDP